MRLWHERLLKYLDRQRLLAQHRECCALRGKGWGMNHSTVNYVFKYERARLYVYHTVVMREMEKRGYNVDSRWKSPAYCGQELDSRPELYQDLYDYCDSLDKNNKVIYPEHNVEQYIADLRNLKAKGVDISNYPGGDLI